MCQAGRAAATIAARLTFERVAATLWRLLCARRASRSTSRRPRWCACSGPSGSGKTTLLRVAAGIEKPTGGRVLINDFEVAGPERFVPPEKRNVGLMFQDFALFPHLTIRDNVAFGLKSLPREDAAREALAALDPRRSRALRRRLPPHPVGRRAAARGARPRHRAAPGRDADGRAVLRPRRAAARAAAGGDAAAAARDARHLPDRHARAGRGDPARRPHRRDARPAGWCRPARPRSSTATRPICSWRGCSPRSTRSPFTVEGGALQDADRHLRGARPRARARRPSCASAGAPSACGRPDRGCPAGCCTCKFLGDQAVLEIAAQGFERPLLTLVREGEEPAARARRWRSPSTRKACWCFPPSGLATVKRT